MEAKNTQANELIRKQQKAAQSQYGMLEAFKINIVLMIFYCLKKSNKSLVQDIRYLQKY